MAGTIQEYATERGIKLLMHFTRASNLVSILQRGLVPRDTLSLGGYNNFNDKCRHDRTQTACLSIEFPRARNSSKHGLCVYVTQLLGQAVCAHIGQL